MFCASFLRTNLGRLSCAHPSPWMRLFPTFVPLTSGKTRVDVGDSSDRFNYAERHSETHGKREAERLRVSILIFLFSFLEQPVYANCSRSECHVDIEEGPDTYAPIASLDLSVFINRFVELSNQYMRTARGLLLTCLSSSTEGCLFFAH